MSLDPSKPDDELLSLLDEPVDEFGVISTRRLYQSAVGFLFTVALLVGGVYVGREIHPMKFDRSDLLGCSMFQQ